VDSKSKILDIGTGKGANLYYMQQRFPSCQYKGLDINEEYVDNGKEFFKLHNINNCDIEYGDLYNLDLLRLADKFNGITCYQTLSWLPEYKHALNNIMKLNPDWIALTSLFYPGLIDARIEIDTYDHTESEKANRSIFYNIYSLPRLENFLSENGYGIFEYCPFDIDIDLPKPDHQNMQTYTRRLNDGKRLQISGPVLMNWFFVYAAKRR